MKPAGLISRVTFGAMLAFVPMVVAAQSSPVRPTHLGGGGAIEISFGRVILSLIICIIIAALAILLIRQRGGKVDLATFFARIEPRAREIQIVETRRLSPHADICLVRHDDREYLLVLQQGSTHVLRDRARDSSAADAPCA